MKAFIRVTAKGASGDCKTAVDVDEVRSVMEVATGGCQILLKGGDFMPISDLYGDVERALAEIEVVFGGSHDSPTKKPTLPGLTKN